MRDRKSEEFKSKLDIRSAKIGISAGVATAIAFEVLPSLAALFGGGVIPAITVTTAGVLIPAFFCKAKSTR
jgi:hypothetical protein